LKGEEGIYSTLGEGKIMKCKSITLVLPLLLMAAVLFILPGVGGAAMWIGGQIGANFVANGDVKFDLKRDTDRLKNVKSDPAFIGGIIIGYDFVKDGFLGYNWPGWMKYFSVAVNLTHNAFTQPAQIVQAQELPRRTPKGQFAMDINHAYGYILELSILFMAKYGFLPTTELPFGRLIPYVGAGPGLFFTETNTVWGYGYSASSDNLEPGIAAEAGVRYMVRRNVSLDAAFRYRYFYPSYDRTYSPSDGPFRGVGRMVVQSFNAIFRANYHF
jgi:opacity protein-like surface antigen